MSQLYKTMKFSLSKYLTEKIQSSIIINELLNDKGGFFKIYKATVQSQKGANNNHYFDKLISLRTRMKYIFTQLHGTSYSYRSEMFVKKDSIPDEKYIKAHTEYMKLYNEYIKQAKRIFTVPSTEALGILLSDVKSSYSSDQVKTDIQNITDNMFKKYTYAELKKNPTVYNTLQMAGIVFFMRNDKTILAFMENGNIHMYSPEIYKKYKNLHITGSDSLEELQAYTQDSENFIFMTYSGEIGDETYEWPIIWKDYYMSGMKNMPDIVDMLHKHYMLSTSYGYSDNGPYTTNSSKSCGKFLHKGSTLYKETTWGGAPDDYVIVYDPMKTFGSTARGYFGSLQGSNHVKQHKSDVSAYVNDRYKWVYDIYGDVIPYGGTKEMKSAKVFQFMKKFEEWTYNSAYEADKYCKKMHELNSKKYKALKDLTASMKNVSNRYKKDIDNNLAQLEYHLQFSKTVQQHISNLSSSTNKITEELSTITSRYVTYQFYINECMMVLNLLNTNFNDIKSIQNKLIQNIQSIKPDNDSYSVDNNQYELRNKTEYINNCFKKAFTYLNTLSDAQSNLEQILNSKSEE